MVGKCGQGGHGIVAGGAERMTSCQSPGSQPRSAENPVERDRLGGVIGARRQEPAGARKIR